jgi:opacity protein-like surface antigen
MKRFILASILAAAVSMSAQAKDLVDTAVDVVVW